jgi:hypothetical protein
VALVADSFVFFHCPRTGGNWVREVVRRMGFECSELGGVHSWPDQVSSEIGERYSFTLHREPLDWLRSWYRVLHGNEVLHGKLTFHPWLLFEGCRRNGFINFVEDVVSKCPGMVSRIFDLYSKGVSVSLILPLPLAKTSGQRVESVPCDLPPELEIAFHEHEENYEHPSGGIHANRP